MSLAPIQRAVSVGIGAISTKVQEVAQSLLAVETATVFSEVSERGNVQLVMDSDPTRSAIRATSILGPLPRGTRVACLTFPPRGVLVLGQSGESDALMMGRLRLLGLNDASYTSTLHPLQIGDTSAAHVIYDRNEILSRQGPAVAGVFPSSTLFLNNDGGVVALGGADGVRSDRMSPVTDRGTGSFSTTSTTFTDAGLPAIASAPYPASGALLITIVGRLTATATASCVLGFELRANGGAPIDLVSADIRSVIAGAGLTGNITGSRTVLATGLPTTGEYEIQAQMRSSNGNSVSVREVDIIAVPAM